MKPQWTADQQKVIDLRDSNILVSAAAGSGKTAVLVERIIGRITDRQTPVDIDRLLVVTFTKAAAAEMRGRIGEALQQKLEQTPDDDNFQLLPTYHTQLFSRDRSRSNVSSRGRDRSKDYERGCSW